MTGDIVEIVEDNTQIVIETRGEIIECTCISDTVIYTEQGLKGDDGAGVPSGGLSGQLLAKKTGEDFDTEWVDNGSSGEANTASNVGLSGIGLYDQKIGVDLQFKNLRPGSQVVTISNNIGQKTVDIDINTATIVQEANAMAIAMAVIGW